MSVRSLHARSDEMKHAKRGAVTEGKAAQPIGAADDIAGQLDSLTILLFPGRDCAVGVSGGLPCDETDQENGKRGCKLQQETSQLGDGALCSETIDDEPTLPVRYCANGAVEAAAQIAAGICGCGQLRNHCRE